MGKKRYGFADIICDKEIELPKYIAIHDVKGNFIEDIDCFYIEDEIVQKPIKELFEELDFDNSEQYYNYIMDSISNGQKTQVKELWFSMELNERTICLKYFENSYKPSSVSEFLKIIIQD